MGPIADVMKKIQFGPQPGPVGQVTQWFDSIMAQVSNAVATIGTLPPPPPTAQSQMAEIDRQLFLQFLMGEIKYLRANRVVNGHILYRKLQHDLAACQVKQKHISAALFRLLGIQGIDVFTSMLNSQRGQTLISFLSMKFEPLNDAYYTGTRLENKLDGYETSAARKILEKVLDDYASDGIFVAPGAWLDLKSRLADWARDREKRVVEMKRLWAATGGGAVGSNPAAMQTIKDYYHKLYEQIEAGGLLGALGPMLGAMTAQMTH